MITSRLRDGCKRCYDVCISTSDKSEDITMSGETDRMRLKDKIISNIAKGIKAVSSLSFCIEMELCVSQQNHMTASASLEVLRVLMTGVLPADILRLFSGH